MLRKIIFILILFLSPSISLAADYRVVSVADGDTITVEPINGSDRIKVRLYGIDCPEISQPYGKEAKNLVHKIALYKEVDLEIKDSPDRYNRTVAIVILNNKTLQEELVRAGLAWVYPQYCKDRVCNNWKSMQNLAKLNKVGLWKDKNPIRK